MFRYAFLAAPSAVADAPKAAAFPVLAACVAAPAVETAVAVSIAAAAAAAAAVALAAAPVDGARS
ncbi:hypothetical protein AB0O64_14555 [Streptomyces sp. NPDC088341]|uniref:hypothetical protein n=1 Tax=Streptomyces sp. NPDC088341 TaxID=3154870 RepID=UPI003442777C